MVLKKSSNRMSVIITARKMIMISWKEKYCGLKMPFRATSIIPFENTAPTRTPAAAMARIILKGAAFEPMAELRKFTASLLTPTIRSEIASRKRTATIRM